MNKKWALINCFYYEARVRYHNSLPKAKSGLVQSIDIALMGASK